MVVRISVLLGILCSLAQGAPAVDSPSDAKATISSLLAQLREFEALNEAQKQRRELGFDLPEELINTYLERVVREGTRPGVKAAKVAFLPSGEVSVRAVLDRAMLSKWGASLRTDGPPSGPDLIVDATLRFECRDRTVRVSVQSVHDEPTRFPPERLERVLQILASNQPEAFDITQPIRLPYGLKTLSISNGVLHGSTR